MQLPLQITFRNLDRSEAVAERIRAKAEELERFHHRLTSCRVAVEALHRRHRKGGLYHVRIDLGVPGGEIVVSREHDEAHEHEDVYVAIRDAFAAAARQLEDFVRRQRAQVKHHDVPSHARVVRIFPQQGYGFLVTPENLEIYFDRNAVTEGDFEALEVGSEVRFAMHEGEGEKGPQASSVTPVGKHHLPDVESLPT